MLSGTIRPLWRSAPKTSGRRSGEPGYSLWPTARARDYKGVGYGDDLPGAVAGRWPTPTSRDATSGAGHGATMQGAPSLRTLVRWPTPTAARYGSGQNGSPHDGREAFAGAGSPSLDTIAAAEGGRLNPAWVEVLMGFPSGWTEIQAGLFAGPPDPASASTDGSRREPHPESPIKTSA